MKKMVLILLLLFTMSLTACGDSNIYVNVENREELKNNILGVDALVRIGNGLWYDSTTRIVYWWNGIISGNYKSTTPTAYYAPNGKPYKYNPKTNTLEEN